jgi:sugar lactone lactonase YvrE
MRVDQVTGPLAFHGEGPVWSSRWGGLRWLDMLAGDMLTLHGDGSVERRHVGSVVAAVRPRRSGGAVIGVRRSFALEEPDGSIVYLDQLWSGYQVRMNEGGCDPEGRFYCGSMAYDQRPGAGSLYRLDADRSVHVVLADVTVSNGLAWSPDGSLAYYNDTATHRVDVFDYHPDAGLTGRRPFVEIPDGGRPDGLAVDVEGGVWTAISNGGAVHRYSSTGRLEEIVSLPVRKVTACAFGGPNLDQLFITTSAEGLATGADPLAGSLFRAEPAMRGLPAQEFAG